MAIINGISELGTPAMLHRCHFGLVYLPTPAHFLIVTLWTGILIQVAWFSKDKQKWSQFLRWFTPFAIVCIIIIGISGLTLMFNVVEPKDYVKSWVLPYGQMLLLKHISIIPVLVFAFINGVLSKKAATIPSFNPRPWIKAESFIILIVFYFTSVLGTLSPPHEVEFTVQIRRGFKMGGMDVREGHSDDM